MVANLPNNIRKSLQNYSIREVYGSSDSTVVLHKLQCNGSYKHFVYNKVKYINSRIKMVGWFQVVRLSWWMAKAKKNYSNKRILKRNKDDKRSQMCSQFVHNKVKCINRRIRMVRWSTKESEKETEVIKKIMCVAAEKSEEIYQLLNKFEFQKVIRITSWIYRFLKNCKRKEKTNETEKEKVLFKESLKKIKVD